MLIFSNILTVKEIKIKTDIRDIILFCKSEINKLKKINLEEKTEKIRDKKYYVIKSKNQKTNSKTHSRYYKRNFYNKWIYLQSTKKILLRIFT